MELLASLFTKATTATAQATTLEERAAKTTTSVPTRLLQKNSVSMEERAKTRRQGTPVLVQQNTMANNANAISTTAMTT